MVELELGEVGRVDGGLEDDEEDEEDELSVSEYA